jgi:hypothetical protein
MDWSHASTLAQSMHIDVIGIAETNVLWTEPRRQYSQSFLKKTIKQANMATCSSTEVGCGEYLPGGIASCVVGNLTGHIIATIKDTSGLGRWAGHILAGKNNKHLVIITAYRPVKAPGFLTTYQQQWRLLRQQNDPNPNPRQQFLTDLEQHIAKWTSQSYEILLMWDANEGIMSHKSDINKFMCKTGLAPIHTTFPSTSYIRGSNCIDFILATTGIRESAKLSGYLPFYDGLWTSDHRGLFVDIHTPTLYHQQSNTTQNQPKRNLFSNYRTQVLKFINIIQKSQRLPDILQKLTELDKLHICTNQNTIEFEQLDTIFTATLLQAEQACALPNHAAWNPPLHESFLIYRYWRIRKSSRSNKTKVTDQLDTITRQVHTNGGDIHQGNQNRPITYQLKLAIKNLRQQRLAAAESRKKHLTFRQETMVLEGKKERAAAIITIQKTERRQQCFRKFHLFTKPPRSTGGIAYTIKQNQDGTNTRIQDPNELATALFNRNRQHFAQAHGTPFTVPPLSNSLNFSDVSQAGKEILEGDYTAMNINNKHTTAINQELKRVQAALPHEMQFNAMITGFFKWRETTTTSPSGKHLGIYRSLIQFHRQFPPTTSIQFKLTHLIPIQT